MAANRTAEVVRETKETQIRVVIDLDGTGASKITTGVGFFDHMLESFARHGGFDLTVGTAEFGNGSTTTHAQIAAERLGTTPDRIRIRQSDTALLGHDTGAFGSTGTAIAGLHTLEQGGLRTTLINAVETGVPAVIYGNVPNTGLITNLPPGAPPST